MNINEIVLPIVAVVVCQAGLLLVHTSMPIEFYYEK